MMKKMGWFLVAVFAAISFAGVAGIYNPGEKINALWLITAALCVYAIAYRFYGAFLASKVFLLDGKHITPAYRLNEGVDYHPTNRWVLFGHHFAAIAGAGPLIGPMLAAQFGFLPGFLWILIGSVFAGAVHDMIILIASVRHDGKSLAEIAREEVGPVGGFCASVAILFIIVVALAGLGLTVVNALTNSPWGTFTIAFTIPTALLMGFYMYKIRPGKIAETSIIGVFLLLFAVFGGHFIPGTFLAPYFTLNRELLIVALAVYGFIASVLPVWLLLCPRDYLSTYMKIGTIVMLTCGVVFLAPEIQMPALTPFIHGGGPIIPGKLFPFMFITIACGAISGFHSLISSGTTPKMIKSENDIQLIGFGAMLTEGFVGIMALIAAAILIPGDYFAINSMLSADQLAAIGFPVSRIQELSQMIGVDVSNRPGGAVSLAVGMASIFGMLPGMKKLMPYWYNFALMFEALFIMTTIDTGTRVARYLLQEMGGLIWKPLARRRWLPGIMMTSLLVVFAWGYLIYSGSVSTIWPMFGVSNQLLAAIALGIGVTILFKAKKFKYVWIPFIPMVCMYIITLTAAWQLTFVFINKAKASMNSMDKLILHVDAGLLVVMALLAIVSLFAMANNWRSLLADRQKI